MAFMASLFGTVRSHLQTKLSSEEKMKISNVTPGQISNFILSAAANTIIGALVLWAAATWIAPVLFVSGPYIALGFFQCFVIVAVARIATATYVTFSGNWGDTKEAQVLDSQQPQ
jgi:hypothetical protein